MQLDYEAKENNEMAVNLPNSTIGILYGEYPHLRETARPVSTVHNLLLRIFLYELIFKTVC